MDAATVGLAPADFAQFPLFSVVDGVPDAPARIALDLLGEAPTLNAAELSAFLGITPAQAEACRNVSRRLW